MAELKIEYLPLDELVTYANNAKIHTAEQIEQIKKSIQEFSMNDPIAIWKNNEIIEGHGRLLALKELGYETVPVIRLDSLTDEQRKAYALVHNKLTMNTDFDIDLLSMELDSIENYDMSDFGFGNDFEDVQLKTDEREKYTTELKLPQYEIKGLDYEVTDLYEMEKVNDLLSNIKKSNVTKKEKEFLAVCAYRHAIIDFRKCAEYYASAGEEMQALMEENALVIIDIEDAIANGFAIMSNALESAMEEDINE